MFVVAPRVPKELETPHAAWRAAQNAAALSGAALIAAAHPGLAVEDPEDPLSLTAHLDGGGRISVRPDHSTLAGLHLDAKALSLPHAQLITDIVHGRGGFRLVRRGTGAPTGELRDAEPGRYAQAGPGCPVAHELVVNDDQTVDLSFPGAGMNAVVGALAALRDPTAVRVHQDGCTVFNCTCQCPTAGECRACDTCACQCQCAGRAT
ncbi:hypothetical protein ACFVIM_30740 [Streptomyces sp. NPDC057638]|uniref:hypothetical protein n=1 Tax=Streptomyces sp. NPDC057638 TaxID=3346190 RepID=UPI0036BED5D2